MSDSCEAPPEGLLFDGGISGWISVTIECCDDLAGVDGRVVSIAILQVLEEKIRLRNEIEEERALCGLRHDGVGTGLETGETLRFLEGWFRWRRRWSAVVRRKQPTWRIRSRRARNLLEKEAALGAMIEDVTEKRVGEGGIGWVSTPLKEKLGEEDENERGGNWKLESESKRKIEKS